MNIYLLCGGGICALCAVMLLKQLKSDFAPYTAAAAATVMGVYCLASLAEPLLYLRDVAVQTGHSTYYTVMLKCLCTAFICKTAAELCRDCGESSIGTKIELGGRAAIILQTLPLIKAIFSLAREMLS